MNPTTEPTARAQTTIPPRSSWLKRILFRVTALAMVLVFVAIAGEVGLRCFSTMGTRIFRDGRYQPGFSAAVYNSESRRPVHIRINAEGFRDEDHAVEKLDDVVRIALIGDSFVADMAVAEQESFTKRLQTQLAFHVDRKVEVLNFGVSGTDLSDHIQNYRYFVRKYRPDVAIVCFFHGNDFTGRNPEVADSSITHPYDKYCLPDIEGVKGFLLRHSKLYNWGEMSTRAVRDSLRGWLVRTAPDTFYNSMRERFDRKWEDYRIYTMPPEPDCVKTWQIIEKQIACLKRETAADGCSLLLVGIPSAEQATAESWASFSKEGGKIEGKGWSRFAPDVMLLSITDKLNISYCALLPEFATSEFQCYFGRGHLNEVGDQIAGRTVAAAVVKENLLPTSLSANAKKPALR